MIELVKDYYIGFEGEPEIIISIKEKGKISDFIRIWEGYFNNIMQQVECDNGKWTSLAYYFNLEVGWYDESPWLVENVKEAYRQLNSIDINELQDIEREVLKGILSCFEYAMENQLDVFISYE